MLSPILAAFCLAGQAAPSEPNLKALEKKLDAVSISFKGRLGYHLEDLTSGKTIGERATERFPSASTIKTAVMAVAMNEIEKGILKWDEPVKLWSKERRHASMWAYHLDEGLKINVDALIQLMMNVSDNTATVVLADRIGSETIEKTLLGWGYEDTAWTSYPPSNNERLVRLRETYANMGVTTPKEMGRLLSMMAKGRLVSQAASERMIRIMSHQYWDDFISWAVPPTVVTASKVGALSRSRSDSAIVFGPRPYVLTIYTDSQKDRRWTSENEGDEAIRKMSALAWTAMNPQMPYSPPKDAKKWAPTGGGVEDS